MFHGMPIVRLLGWVLRLKLLSLMFHRLVHQVCAGMLVPGYWLPAIAHGLCGPCLKPLHATSCRSSPIGGRWA